MVNSTFDPSIHLTVQDLQVDVEVNPSSLCMGIKSSKNDLFPPGCFIYLGRALSNFGHPGIFTSLRALIWSPVHRQPWSAFNSFSSVFLHPVCVTGGGNPWQFSSHSFRIGAANSANVNQSKVGGRRFIEDLYQVLFSFSLAHWNVFYKAKRK